MSMKPRILLCLALILSGGLTGCETESIGEGRVSLANLYGDGRIETNMVQECSGGLINGKTSTAFSLGSPSCWLLLYYPTNQMNQTSRWQTDSRQVYAWLVRSQLDCQTLWSVKTPSALPFPNSEPLNGKIEVGEYDWRHNNRRYFAFNLTGTNGVVLKVEMNSHTKTEFDAKQLWLDPYLIIFGPFLKW